MFDTVRERSFIERSVWEHPVWERSFRARSVWECSRYGLVTMVMMAQFGHGYGYGMVTNVHFGNAHLLNARYWEHSVWQRSVRERSD